jgi:anaerobic magnesium-protoporphyrin IX monomethyl ester cyclase
MWMMNNMRITLIKPPEPSLLNFGNFSLAVLAAAVRDIAEIIILDTSDLKLTIAVQNTIDTYPDWVGVTTMGLTSVNPASDFIRSLHNVNSNITIVAGGHGATMLPKPLLDAGVDAVVYGEGELTFRELILKGISKKIRGLALLDEGELMKTPPRPLIPSLDDLSEPAYNLIASNDFCNNGTTLLETSRGCPHSCTFCEATRFYQCQYRARSPKKVANDIQKLVENGATIIHIADDNFTANPKRALEICDLVQHGSMPLFFYFSSRTDDLLRLPELIPALAKSHFLRTTIGIETLNPELASNIQKPISFNQHHQAIKAMKKTGIYSVASFILGLPGETATMRKQSVELAVKIGVDSAHFVPFQPLPGTPMEKGYGAPEPWCIEAANKATLEFMRNPIVISRLLEAAKKDTVYGMLARASLVKRLQKQILNSKDSENISQKLEQIS